MTFSLPSRADMRIEFSSTNIQIPVSPFGGMKEEEPENSQGILHKCALAAGKCEQWLHP